MTTLGSMKNVVKVSKEKVNIDPSKLFSRLLIISEREGDIQSHFDYELTPTPSSLFLNKFIRKSNKALLLQHLFGKDYQLVERNQIIKTDVNVVDGGALLRQINWQNKLNFGSILDYYSSYAKSKYGMLTIVFDGYSGGPSTKDHEHSRRGSSTCPDFNIKRETLCTVTQQSFLTNSNNKTGLLAILIPQLIEDGHTVKQAVSDADRLIVRTAVQAASDGRSVTVFANDTDVITMLLHHWEEHMSSIVVRSEFKSKGNTVWKQLDIREASLFLNPEVKNFLLFYSCFWGM